MNSPSSVYSLSLGGICSALLLALLGLQPFTW
jgi:hypothetical protein